MAAEGEGGDDPDQATGPSAIGFGEGDGDNAGDGTDGDGKEEGDGDPTGETASSRGSAQGSAGVAAGGSGIGNAPGGPVLGTRTPGSGSATTGHDAPTSVASKTAGPSRSQVIGGAAAQGFASTEYRRVFTDYSSVVEESLDNAAVPPGRRYLVRRYFQLIRPRD